jgi:hypothetical protein
MAENLIILVAVASMVGVFFLVLFSVLARRERRALRKLKGANPSTRGVGTFQLRSDSRADYEQTYCPLRRGLASGSCVVLLEALPRVVPPIVQGSPW